MTVVIEHIKHETKEGVLTIDINLHEDDETISVSAVVKFECHDTGAIFAKTFETAEILGLHRIFDGMPELFIDFVREVPSIKKVDDSIAVEYRVAHGRRVYEFTLSFGRQVHEFTAEAVDELWQENRVLRRQIKALTDNLATLTNEVAALWPKVDVPDLFASS